MTDSPAVPGRIDRDRLARVAATAARAVPGVRRLQPDLKHLVGRAARELFAGLAAAGESGLAAPDDTYPTGIDVDRTPDGIDVTLRVVTGTSPAPHQVALDVLQSVADALAATGLAARVRVVVVDVET